MNLLSLDTSTEFLSLAIQAGDTLFTHHQHVGNASSELILPQIQALLEEANVKLSDLDGIAFGAGPGAFTGVRIACGVAQGLGFGANVPVVGINTLHAIAQASGAQKVIVCTDARMGEVYLAALEKVGEGWSEIIETQVTKPEAAPMLAASAYDLSTCDLSTWLAAGSGWKVYDETLSVRFAVTKKLPNITPTAEAILQLATPIFINGLAKPAAEARPIYIRNRVALTSIERAEGQRL